MKQQNIPPSSLNPLPPEPEQDYRTKSRCEAPTKDYWYEAGNAIRWVRLCACCARRLKAQGVWLIEGGQFDDKDSTD